MLNNVQVSIKKLTNSHVMLNAERMNSEREINASRVLKDATLAPLRVNAYHALPTFIVIFSVMRLE